VEEVLELPKKRGGGGKGGEGGEPKRFKPTLEPIELQPNEGDIVCISFQPKRPNQIEPDDGEVLTATLEGEVPKGHFIINSFEWLNNNTGPKVDPGEAYLRKCPKGSNMCENCPLKDTFMECTRGLATHRDRATGNYTRCKNQRLGTRTRAQVQLRWFKGVGIGLVAVGTIKIKSTIGEYTGVRKRKTTRRTVYQAELTDDFILDGEKKCTFMRYVNYHCGSNASMTIWIVEGKLAISINATVTIPPGSQITMPCMDGNYVGKCNCKDEKCKGELKLQAVGSTMHTGDSDSDASPSV
jgi:hypothetical protein